MNTRIRIEIAIGIIILVTFVLGGFIWFGNREKMAVLLGAIESKPVTDPVEKKVELAPEKQESTASSLNELVVSQAVVGSQVVTGYLWHSYKGSPNFSSVILPVWGMIGDKEFMQKEYTIDIWDGKDFVFYTKTTVLKEVTFPTGGVYKFRVQGINPDYAICPGDRSSTWGLKFATAGTFKGERVPITLDVSPQGKSCRVAH